jgi:hypothetical protein
LSIHAHTRRTLLRHFAISPPLFVPAVQAQANLTVFAASSLTDSMKAVAAAYEKTTGTKVTLSFGASDTLVQQIDQGVGGSQSKPLTIEPKFNLESGILLNGEFADGMTPCLVTAIAHEIGHRAGLLAPGHGRWKPPPPDRTADR